ncbi:MAG: hypothetical protein LBG48_01245, partial [Rickettsiales bacterium]|nr:hypothetical protein [Rickettsiales bacterium]
MALIPSTPVDKAALKAFGVNGYVYPLDEALGINQLPYNVTLAAMLEVCRVATKGESFEDAENELKKYTKILINDDTMRRITNIIGSIVFENDKIDAEKAWAQFNSANLVFSGKKINHTLYFEVDGAMLPTRQDNKKGSVYKENKLGMAFSSDNIHTWVDKHGKRQRQITRRRYTSYIGDSDFFSKLMLSLALKSGYGEYVNTVLLSDGATWIRNMKDSIFPEAQQILDFYHLKEHVSDYAKLLFDSNEEKYTSW